MSSMSGMNSMSGMSSAEHNRPKGIQPTTAFFESHLLSRVLPFWERAVDATYGGVLTCFDNTGEHLLSTDKYTWSQGRFLWMWSRIVDDVERGRLSAPSAFRRYPDDCRRTARFLADHALMDNGNAVFLTTEDGTPKRAYDDVGMDASIYADCFVCVGWAQYAAVFGEQEYLERALLLYRRIVERIDDGRFATMPYPIHPGCSMLGVPMFAMYTGNELYQALVRLGDDRTAGVAGQVERFARALERTFYVDPYNVEVVGPTDITGSVLEHHLTPGHTVESLWFYIHAVEAVRGAALSPAELQKVARIGRWALEKGWDNRHGGIFRFVDRNGGPPGGLLVDDPYERLIRQTWDTKLWWVHSEALYFTALMAARTEDSFWTDMHHTVFDYTFSVFPHPDPTIGEWIQIRGRDGRPLDQVVALPVKDPYHIVRNLLLCVELGS